MHLRAPSSLPPARGAGRCPHSPPNPPGAGSRRGGGVSGEVKGLTFWAPGQQGQTPDTHLREESAEPKPGLPALPTARTGARGGSAREGEPKRGSPHPPLPGYNAAGPGVRGACRSSLPGAAQSSGPERSQTGDPRYPARRRRPPSPQPPPLAASSRPQPQRPPQGRTPAPGKGRASPPGRLPLARPGHGPGEARTNLGGQPEQPGRRATAYAEAGGGGITSGGRRLHRDAPGRRRRAAPWTLLPRPRPRLPPRSAAEEPGHHGRRQRRRREQQHMTL